MEKTRKSLSEQIAERQKSKGSNRNNANLAMFLVHRSAIKEAMEDGWNVKAIWDTLYHDEDSGITFGYDAFLRYVKRFINTPGEEKRSTVTGAQAANKTTKPKPAPIKPTSTIAKEKEGYKKENETIPETRTTEPEQKFIWNPVAGNLDDLLRLNEELVAARKKERWRKANRKWIIFGNWKILQTCRVSIRTRPEGQVKLA